MRKGCPEGGSARALFRQQKECCSCHILVQGCCAFGLSCQLRCSLTKVQVGKGAQYGAEVECSTNTAHTQHTHTHTNAHTHTHSNTHARTIVHKCTYAYTIANTRAHTHTLAHTIHTHTLTHNTHTKHTHTQTHNTHTKHTLKQEPAAMQCQQSSSSSRGSVF